MNAKTDGPVALHKLRKIEIVVQAEDQTLVTDLLVAAGVSGWTILRDVAGMGHDGFHQGRSIFNDQTGLVMVIAVADEAAIAQAGQGLARLFRQRPGVTFLSDVEVIRSDYFVKAGSVS